MRNSPSLTESMAVRKPCSAGMKFRFRCWTPICYIGGVPTEYVPAMIYILLAGAFLIALLFVAKLLRPSVPSKVKQEIYECGIPTLSNARGRYSVRFYIIAILFVVFDVETIFLFPWAVRYKQLGWFGVAEVAVFLAILFVGYIWAYKKKALRWS